MGKYAKIVLVLLYAAQLGVAFRDELVNLYHQAVALVRRDVTEEHRDDRIEEPEIIKRTLQPRFDALQTLATLPFTPFALAHANHVSHDEPHPPHTEDDRHKDKARKQRLPSLREIMYANLIRANRLRRIPSSAAEPRPLAELLSLILPPSSHRAT